MVTFLVLEVATPALETNHERWKMPWLLLHFASLCAREQYNFTWPSVHSLSLSLSLAPSLFISFARKNLQHVRDGATFFSAGALDREKRREREDFLKWNFSHLWQTSEWALKFRYYNLVQERKAAPLMINIFKMSVNMRQKKKIRHLWNRLVR